MHKTTLYILRGLPGSGKSTWARSRHVFTPMLEADMYFVSAKGDYEFDPEKLHAAHRWCQNTARIMLNNGISVVVSNTFTKLDELRPYLDSAQDCGAQVEITELKQNFGSIHGVPEEAMKRMAARWQSSAEVMEFAERFYPALQVTYKMKDEHGLREVEHRKDRECASL